MPVYQVKNYIYDGSDTSLRVIDEEGLEAYIILHDIEIENIEGIKIIAKLRKLKVYNKFIGNRKIGNILTGEIEEISFNHRCIRIPGKNLGNIIYP